MLLDYLGNEIHVGDYIVYGAGRGYLEYGLVTDIIDEVNLGYNGWRRGKIKLARLQQNLKFVYDDTTQIGKYIDLGGYKVKCVTQSNAAYTVVLLEDMILNNNDFLLLRRFKQEILNGLKVVGSQVN